MELRELGGTPRLSLINRKSRVARQNVTKQFPYERGNGFLCYSKSICPDSPKNMKEESKESNETKFHVENKKFLKVALSEKNLAEREYDEKIIAISNISRPSISTKSNACRFCSRKQFEC